MSFIYKNIPPTLIQKISQTGVGTDPSIDFESNDTSDTFTWTWMATGTYALTSASGTFFTPNTWVSITPGGPVGAAAKIFITYEIDTSFINTLTIYVTRNGNLTDGFLEGTSIELRNY